MTPWRVCPLPAHSGYRRRVPMTASLRLPYGRTHGDEVAGRSSDKLLTLEPRGNLEGDDLLVSMDLGPEGKVLVATSSVLQRLEDQPPHPGRRRSTGGTHGAPRTLRTGK